MHRLIILTAIALALPLAGCVDASKVETTGEKTADQPICYGLFDDQVDVVISLQPLTQNRYESFGFGTEIDRKGLDHVAFKLSSEGQLSGERFMSDMSMKIAGREIETRAEWRISGRKLFTEAWALEEEDCRRLTSGYLKRDIRRKKRAEKIRAGAF